MNERKETTDKKEWKKVLARFKKLDSRYALRKLYDGFAVFLEIGDRSIDIAENMPVRDGYWRNAPFYTYVKPPFIYKVNKLRKKFVKKVARDLTDADIAKLHKWVMEAAEIVESCLQDEKEKEQCEKQFEERMGKDFEGVKGAQVRGDTTELALSDGSSMYVSKGYSDDRYNVQYNLSDLTKEQVLKLRDFLEKEC